MTFFFLSIAFYWIPDTSRRRALHLSLIVCTLVLGVGSEVVQGLLPNDRPFDLFDLLANVVGSLGAVGLCGWYHRRMLERRRKARYGSLSENSAHDVELGEGGHEGGGLGPQESGTMTLEQEVDNWDENAVDNWDSDDGTGNAAAAAHGHSGSAPAEHDDQKPLPAPPAYGEEAGQKKRSD